ncbi:MAG: hypothetical protein ISS78_11080 [Phycisphaerae bacterium]|nr:hypothetical protein [Phycisphaerae bacterium]
MARKKAKKAARKPIEPFQRRLETAVWAGWCTVLIWFCVMTFSWVIWQVFLHVHPEWVRCLWGGGALRWAAMQKLVLLFFGMFKMMLWVFLMVVVFLALWLRRLKQV